MTQTVVHVPASEGGGSFDPTDIVITDNTSGAFLIKDDSGSPTEYMRIDTTSGSELTKFVVHDDGANYNKLVVATDRSGSDLIAVTPRRVGLGNTEGVFFSGDSSTQVWVYGPSTFRTQNAALVHNLSSTQTAVTYLGGTSSWNVNGAGGNIVKFDYDSNTTFTLDVSESGVFKVQDDSANNYIKLDTTSGSELTNLKAGGTQGINISGNSRTDIVTGSAASDTDLRIINSGGTQIFQVKGNHDTRLRAQNFIISDKATDTAYLLTDTNTNFTYTLNSSNNAVFKVQDDLASPTQFLTIDSNTSSESIKLALTPANADRFFEMTSSKIHARCQNSQINMGTSGITFTAYDDYAFGQYGAGKKLSFVDRQTAEERFSVDKESNATFTLDDGSGAAFKVVNNAGSPKNFLVINDGGNTVLDSENTTYLRAQGHSYIVMTGTEIQMGASGKFAIHQTGYPLYKRSPNLVTLGATSTTSVVSLQSDGQYKKVTCSPSTSGQTFTLEFQDGTSTNRDYVVEQDFAIHNNGTENCTIQATITSGRGSALGKDLSAGGSTSGELVTGMTLNAGKSALFKAVKWNKELTGTATTADNEFMFQTIMVEA